MAMNKQPPLAELAGFAEIVSKGSFRSAAHALGQSPSTLSHMMRGLEARLGVRLLHRTTRSVAPTEAGARLLARMAPILRDYGAALAEFTDLQQGGGGVLRLNVPPLGAQWLLEAAVPRFLERYPAVTLDLSVEDKLVDIVAGGFDAGVRLGEFVPQDMVAVPVSRDVRFIAVASPGYLERYPAPRVPDDLMRHRCIRIRLPSGRPYRWEFARNGQEVAVDVPGVLILDDMTLLADAARAGLGIAYVVERSVGASLRDGSLVALLGEWCPAVPGLFLYYSGHRHVPPALRAFIDIVKDSMC